MKCENLSGTSAIRDSAGARAAGTLLVFPGTELNWKLRDFRHGLIEHSKFGVSTLYMGIQSPVCQIHI